MAIKAIIFDYDGVMADSYKFHLNAVLETAKILHLPFSNHDYDKFYPRGCSLREGTSNYLKHLSRDHLFDEFIQIKKSFDNRYFAEIVGIPGVIDFIQQVKTDYRLSIVSGTRRTLVNMFLQKYRLEEYFELVITAEDVHRGKPDPEGYQIALTRLDLQPNEALVIEDGQNGVEAAKSIKILTIGLELKSEKLIGVDFIARSYDEIIYWLKL